MPASKFHDRVNHLCAKLNARQNNYNYARGTTAYTNIDADLDSAVADLLRSMDTIYEMEKFYWVLNDQFDSVKVFKTLDESKNHIIELQKIYKEPFYVVEVPIIYSSKLDT
jgi:hypothetical protein